MSSPTPIDVYSLIQPELLDKNELIRILESRLVCLSDSQKECKEQLVEIFKRVAVPLSQRTYPDNNLGKRLNKLRKEFEKNRKNDSNTEPQNGLKSPNQENSREKSNSSDSINFEKKKIKLNNHSNGKNTSSSSTKSESGEKSARKRSLSPPPSSSSPTSSGNKQRKKIVWP